MRIEIDHQYPTIGEADEGKTDADGWNYSQENSAILSRNDEIIYAYLSLEY